MKIGLVRRGYSATGGAEMYLRRFASAARTVGHECVLFADAGWPEDAWPGERIILKGRSPRAFADAVAAACPRDHCDYLLSLERIWHCDAYRAGDGVHVAWLERRARYEPFWRPLLRRLNPKHCALLEIERALFSAKGAALIIANSQMVKREIEHRFAVHSSRIHVIYNGVPTTSATIEARMEFRRDLGLDSSDYVLLFAGSGWERKGLRFAIEAINAVNVSRSILLVAGSGKRETMPRSSRVRYLGPVQDLAPILTAADVFLLPTIYEPFSNACLEAFAAGLPVITSAHNGFAEIIERDVEGDVLEEPADTAALARAIEGWAAPERRDAIRARLHAKGARFSIEENVRTTLAIIEKARESAAFA
jgi:UDP-glucose:(heptosyl)LPS alpha-1,3-glucosyltransferase